MADPENDVAESRSYTRYILEPPLGASFGKFELSIEDIAETGFRVEHAEPLRLGYTSPVSFSLPNSQEHIALRSKVVWSHLCERTGPDGKFLYQSGLRIEDEQDSGKVALEKLLRAYSARPAADSLEKKRAKLEKKVQKKDHDRTFRVIRQTRQIPADQLLMVQQARRYLTANPNEATKWYNRAKYAVSATTKGLAHRDNVLAVWEYLERSVELETVVWVFDNE